MSNIKRRLEKIEKKLRIEKPHLVVNIAGLEMTSDEFTELLEKINGTSKGVLPSKDELLQVEAWEKEGML
ncbi:MAG: hypothetical protein GY774_38610 [Planctomycetes bacterium]|nr:hypothetical protein [Planctomycetota bacterium]